MRLLQVTGTLAPAYGGPPVVLNQITDSLSALGHIVDVATLDSSGEPWMGDTPGRHLYAFGPASRRYRYSYSLPGWLRQHASDYDAILVHGIWQYQSVAARKACDRANVPYLIFVHGALDPWFEKRYPLKHAKKSVYWRLFENRVFRDARYVLFTREEERQLARTSFSPYRATEAVVDVGIHHSTGDTELQRVGFLSLFPELQGRRVVLFMGRLHPKKGCDLLIRAFAAVCDRDPDLHLVLAGPDEGHTKEGLTSLSGLLGISDRITWTGMLRGDTKWGAYHAADVFALMSHSENFGLVIPEALACGVPVLTTDKVNIWREIEDSGAGFVDSDTEAGAAALLQRWLMLTDSERAGMRESALRCFADNFDPDHAAGELLDLLSRAIDHD